MSKHDRHDNILGAVSIVLGVAFFIGVSGPLFIAMWKAALR